MDNNPNATRGASLLFGFLENCSGIENPIIDIRNVSLKNSVVATGASTTYAGFVYGYMNKNPSISPNITGSNILIRDCKVGYNTTLQSSIDLSTPAPLSVPDLSYDGTNTGIFGGYCKGNASSVKLVGVSLWNNDTRAKDFGDTGPASGSYVIRADYLADTTGTTGSAYPHVVTSPAKAFPGIDKNGLTGILTGDGVAFSAAPKSIAQGVLENYNDTNFNRNRTHFNVPEAMAHLNGKAGVLTTYNTSSENDTLENDFPVLLIAENDSKAINDLVAAYLSMMTNHVEYTKETINNKSTLKSYQYSDFFTITPTTYHWDGAKFVPLPDTETTLKATGNVLSINSGRYDNQRNQFTLLDVAYKDPTGGSTPVYHLYIPVVVKKVLPFKVWFSAKQGTDYYTSVYGPLNSSALTSHGQQVTTLITFEYRRDINEWRDAVNNGDNLNWNFVKSILLCSGNGLGIPAGTRLTLVDRNNQDKAYFGTLKSSLDVKSATAGGTLFRFSDYLDGFSEVPLYSLLKLERSQDPVKNGKYVEENNPEDITIMVDGQGYRPFDETKDVIDGKSKVRYDINVTGFANGDTYPQEQYYLTIQTDKAASDFLNLLLHHRSRLENPDGKIGLPSSLMPARSEDVKETGNQGTSVHFTKNGDENHIVIGNFFTQTASVVTLNTEDEMSGTNDTIKGQLTVTVTVDSKDDIVDYGVFKGDYVLNQCFELYLMEMVNQNQGTLKPFADGGILTVTSVSLDGVSMPVDPSLALNGENRIRLSSVPITWDKNADVLSHTVTIDFDLSYSLSGINGQFPEKGVDGSGILVCADSLVSYFNDMSRSIVSDPLRDGNNHRYYKGTLNFATLTYNAYQDAYGTQKYGWSQLGINPLDPNGYFLVQSAALYDVREVSNAPLATQLRLTFGLLQKDENGNYTINVTEQLGSYLKYLHVKPRLAADGGFLPAVDVVNSGGVAVYGLSGTSFNSTVPIELEVDMEVITGEDFAGTYANYKLELTAELQTAGESISGSGANDFIIYTNAKICPTLIS